MALRALALRAPVCACPIASWIPAVSQNIVNITNWYIPSDPRRNCTRPKNGDVLSSAKACKKRSNDSLLSGSCSSWCSAAGIHAPSPGHMLACSPMLCSIVAYMNDLLKKEMAIIGNQEGIFEKPQVI